MATKKIIISEANPADFLKIWPIFQDVIAAGDTYVNRADTTYQEAYEKWFNKDSKTFIAKVDDEIIGAYLIKPNQIDRGSHIANCSYIVSKTVRGLGCGKLLGEHSIAVATKLKYRAIQFNFVVSTNIAAVNLWKSLGFVIIATLPEAFNHKELGYVDVYVMFRKL